MLRWVWKLCHLISTQLNTFRRFWTDVSDNACRHHCQNINWGNIFRKNGVPSLSTVPETFRIYTKAQWCCSGGLLLPNTLLRHCMLFFYLSPVYRRSLTAVILNIFSVVPFQKQSRLRIAIASPSTHPWSTLQTPSYFSWNTRESKNQWFNV